MMTVEELIEELRKYPADMAVLVRSYELGYDPIKKLAAVPDEESTNLLIIIDICR